MKGCLCIKASSLLVLILFPAKLVDSFLTVRQVLGLVLAIFKNQGFVFLLAELTCQFGEHFLF